MRRKKRLRSAGRSIAVIEQFERRLLLSGAPATPQAPPPTVSFTTTTTRYSGGFGTPALADLNGDGKLDLLLTNGTVKSVSYSLGNGDGTFQTPVVIPVGVVPTGITVADLNGDGKPDLLIPDNANTVIFLAGQGGGKFAPPVSYTVGNSPIKVIVGDFNGDGRLDFLTANATDKTVTVMLQTATGTFQALAPLSLPDRPLNIAAADLNGDGKLDLAVSMPSLHTYVLRGNGDGTFTILPPLDAPNTIYHTGLAVGDFNGDGYPDILVADNSNPISLFLNDGKGGFLAPQSGSIGGWIDSLYVGNENSDGIPDVLAGGNENALWDSNSDAVLFGSTGGLTSTVHATGSGPVVDGFSAVGDLNGDGLSDVVTIGNGNSGLELDVSIANPLAAISVAPLVGEPSNATVADFIDNQRPASTDGLTATIDWGDGYSSAGTIVSDGGGNYHVVGSHEYTYNLGFAHTVTVRDAAGNQVKSAPASVTIPNPPGATSVTEFPIGTPVGIADNILPGAGGNLWFNEFQLPDAGTGITRAGQITPTGAVTSALLPSPATAHSPAASDLSGHLWLLDSDNELTRIDSSDNLTSFPVSNVPMSGTALSRGPDGNVWFSVTSAPGTNAPIGSLGDIADDGTVTLVPLTKQLAELTSLTSGADGNLWGAESDGAIARISPAGQVTEFPLPQGGGAAQSITAGADGNVWFILAGSSPEVARITPDGTITQFAIPRGDPVSLTPGPDGAMWFTELNADRIGRITSNGSVMEYLVPTGNILPITPPNSQGITSAQPYEITAGMDGNVWFTERAANQIGRVNLAAAPVLTPIANPMLRRNIALSGTLATLVDPTSGRTPSDYQVSINWGDGTTTAGILTAAATGGFAISGAHTYSAERNELVSITVTPPNDVPLVTYFTAQVQDYPLSITSAPIVFAIGGQVTGPATVMTFSDADPNATQSDYAATITWSDGTTSVGSVSPGPNGTWVVSAVHTFTTDGTFPFHVHVQDSGGNSLDADSKVNVGDPLMLQQTAGLSLIPSQAMVIGDVNGDQIPDLITAAGGNLDVCLGNGDGTFGVPIVMHTPGSVLQLRLADVNRDGKPDIVMSDWPTTGYTADISVLLNQGNGAFAAAQSVGSGSNDMAITDFNGDGNPDIVTTGDANHIGLLLGNGDGTFTSQPIDYTGVGRHFSVVTGDFNGDGKMDFAMSFGAATNGSTQVVVWLGNGDGTFKTPEVYPISNSGTSVGSTVLLSAADVNGDKKTDLLLADSFHATFGVLLNAGDGTFEPETTGLLETVSPSPPPSVNAPGAISAVLATDVNGDGLADLVFADSVNGTLRIRLGRGDGTFQPETVFSRVFPTTVVSAADLNNDGLPDVTAAEGPSSAVQIFLANPLSIAAEPGLNAVEGTSQVFTLASFAHEDGAIDTTRYTATINWGNGFNSAGTIVDLGGGRYGITGSHLYASAGQDSVGVTISGPGGIESSAISTISVTDAPLAGVAHDFSATASAPLTTILANFSDTNPYSLPGDFSAQVSWGDGTSSTALVRADGTGNYAVLATHAYESTGAYSGSVSIVDVSGANVSLGFRATITSYINGGGSISGHVFNDSNADGYREVGEPPIPGATVFLDANNNGALDPGEISTLTDSAGMYMLADVPEGTWHVRMLALLGYQITTPADNSGVSVNLIQGQVLDGVNLGAARLTTAVVGRYVFYNNSWLDAGTPGPSPSDDNAIAVDKAPMLPGHTPVTSNVTSYAKGINGVMIDVLNMPGVPTGDDLAAFMGSDPMAPAGFVMPATPSSITIRPLTDNITRITLIWPDNMIVGKWVQVTVKASDNTGLSADDVFYFGNMPANDGDSPTGPVVQLTQVDDGSAQRSLLRTFTLKFDHPVALVPGAFSLVRLNTGGSGANDNSAPTDLSAGLAWSNPSSDGETWIVSFAGESDAQAGSLSDGIYTLTLHAALVHDIAQNQLVGGDQSFTFHRLFGDIDGNKTVNNLDYLKFRKAYGSLKTNPATMLSYNPNFDYDNNGIINNLDYLHLKANYGKSLVY